MINPVYLGFVEILVESLVKCFCRRQVITEWFFNNQPLPAFAFVCQAFGRKVFGNDLIYIRGGRQVKDIITGSPVFPVQFINTHGQGIVTLFI